MKLLFLIFFLGLGIKLSAQINLVPNPSFEVYDTCPNSGAQIARAVPWFQPYTPESSTDYYNACALTNYGVPSNIAGYQTANTGYAYAGFSPGFANGSNIREYLEVELDYTLNSGKQYCISFNVSFANSSRVAVDMLGAVLTSTPVYYSNPPWGVLPLIPQLENQIGNIISDTL